MGYMIFNFLYGGIRTVNRNFLIEAMIKNGVRVTPHRTLIAEAFVNNEGWVLPRDIHALLSESNPGVSLDTVYRNLKLFVKMGLLEEHFSMSGVSYKLKINRDSLHYSFTCTNCHKTYQNEFTMESSEVLPEAVNIASHNLEFYGTCKKCVTTH